MAEQPPRPSRQAEFHNSIAYHRAGDNPEVLAKFRTLREAAKEFGDVVFANTEPSREQSVSLTHIEDALMWATKQIAINELPVAD